MLISFASNAAGADIWQVVDTPGPGVQQRAAASSSGSRLFRADVPALRAALADAPAETAGRRDYRLQLPMPDGKLKSFVVAESPILAPALAAKYPQIKSYRVFPGSSGEASGRISMTSGGFQAMVFSPDGRIFITSADPASSDPVYRSEFTADAEPRAFTCGADGHSRDLEEWVTPTSNRASRVAGNLLRYRIAIAATLEYYTLTGGGSDTGTTNQIVAAMNSVNAIYERDLGITLQLAANNDLLYETVDSGLLDNEDSFQLLDQVNSWIDDRIGDPAYDIGHIFSQPASGSAGVANLGAVCDSAIKAGGVSGSSTPL
ncbi:MAG: zinc-dependent metalloprotease family protein, partial [Gammaproteobacteria bacterium]